jgi:hypothetical protein
MGGYFAVELVTSSKTIYVPMTLEPVIQTWQSLPVHEHCLAILLVRDSELGPLGQV